MVEAAVGSLVDSFMEVGVFVATMLAVFSCLQYRWASSVARIASKFRRTGPIFAAVLSLPPGCSGVIAVVSMYGRSGVSFGSVVAALVSTMGDSSWILLTANFGLAVVLKLLFFAVGSALGLAVDFWGYDPRAQSGKGRRMATQILVPSQSLTAEYMTQDFSRSGRLSPEGFREVLSPPSSPSGSAGLDSSPHISYMGNRRLSRLGVVSAVFWCAVVLGLVMKIPVEMNVVSEEGFEETFGPLNPYTITGVAGTLSAIVIAILGKRQCHCLTANGISVVRNLRHISVEASRIIPWVAMTYGAWAIVTEVAGLEIGAVGLNGVGGVVLAALIGLLPSCGLEVVVAGLFTTGAISLPVLITYLLSHDGAGLIPLFAIHRKSALVATIFTTITALVIGLVAYVIAS